MALYPAQERVPAKVWLEVLSQAAEVSLPIGRRMALLGILWNESYLPREALIARVEALSGMGCFGKQASLTFARDIKFVRKVLRAAGYQLRYSRNKRHPGYYIPGRPALHPGLVKLIQAAVEEVNPEQVAIYAGLTPAQRVRQGASLSDRLRRQAASRLMVEDPTLDEAEANREVLQRMYRHER